MIRGKKQRPLQKRQKQEKSWTWKNFIQTNNQEESDEAVKKQW